MYYERSPTHVKHSLVQLCESMQDIPATVDGMAMQFIQENIFSDKSFGYHLVNCVEGFPLKTSFYACLIQSIRVRVGDGTWLNQLFTQIASKIDQRVTEENIISIKLYLRFLADLTGAKVISGSSLLTILKNLLSHGSILSLYLTLMTILFFPPSLQDSHKAELDHLFDQCEELFANSSRTSVLGLVFISNSFLRDLSNNSVPTVLDRLFAAVKSTRQAGWPRGTDSGILRLYENSQMVSLLCSQQKSNLLTPVDFDDLRTPAPKLFTTEATAWNLANSLFTPTPVAWEPIDMLSHRAVSSLFADSNGNLPSLKDYCEIALNDHVQSVLSLFESAPEMCAYQLLKISRHALFEVVLVTSLFSALSQKNSNSSANLQTSTVETLEQTGTSPVCVAAALNHICALQASVKPLIASFINQSLPAVKFANVNAVSSVSDVASLFISSVVQDAKNKNPNGNLNQQVGWLIGYQTETSGLFHSANKTLFSTEIMSRLRRLLNVRTLADLTSASNSEDLKMTWCFPFSSSNAPEAFISLRRMFILKTSDATSTEVLLAELNRLAPFGEAVPSGFSTQGSDSSSEWDVLKRTRLFAAALFDSGAVTLSHMQRALELYYVALTQVIKQAAAYDLQLKAEEEVVRAIIRGANRLPARLEFAVDFLLRENVVSAASVISTAVSDFSLFDDVSIPSSLVARATRHVETSVVRLVANYANIQNEIIVLQDAMRNLASSEVYANSSNTNIPANYAMESVKSSLHNDAMRVQTNIHSIEKRKQIVLPSIQQTLHHAISVCMEAAVHHNLLAEKFASLAAHVAASLSGLNTEEDYNLMKKLQSEQSMILSSNTYNDDERKGLAQLVNYVESALNARPLFKFLRVIGQPLNLPELPLVAPTSTSELHIKQDISEAEQQNLE